MIVSTFDLERNCVDKHHNTSLGTLLWQHWCDPSILHPTTRIPNSSSSSSSSVTKKCHKKAVLRFLLVTKLAAWQKSSSKIKTFAPLKPMIPINGALAGDWCTFKADDDYDDFSSNESA